MAGYSQARFLVITKESLGLTYKETLDSSYSLIETMLQEYGYICHERNKYLSSDNEDNSQEGEWMETIDFETGGLKRVKIGKSI